VSTVQVHAQFADGVRQFVVEGDLGGGAGGPADRRPREAAAEGPELGLGAREDLLLGEADRDLEARRGQLDRDRQRLAERDRGLGGPDPLEVGERAAEAAAGESDEQRATAQGAEEGPAPEARREL
jgi:hypothetical protein